MYKNIDIFKEVEINFENVWGWCKIAKWDCGILWKVKVMFKLIITNNITCGYICDCEAYTVEHILFQCKNVKNIHRILWQKVIEKMPILMIEKFNSRTTREKVIYIFTAVYMGNP